MENEHPITAAPTAGSRKYQRSPGSTAGGSRCRERCQMSTLRAQNRKPGRDDRDFVEIQMRGTTRELAQIQGEGSSPKPMETTIESRVRSPNARYQVSLLHNSGKNQHTNVKEVSKYNPLLLATTADGIRKGLSPCTNRPLARSAK